MFCLPTLKKSSLAPGCSFSIEPSHILFYLHIFCIRHSFFLHSFIHPSINIFRFLVCDRHCAKHWGHIENRTKLSPVLEEVTFRREDITISKQVKEQDNGNVYKANKLEQSNSVCLGRAVPKEVMFYLYLNGKKPALLLLVHSFKALLWETL